MTTAAKRQEFGLPPTRPEDVPLTERQVVQRVEAILRVIHRGADTDQLLSGRIYDAVPWHEAEKAIVELEFELLRGGRRA